MMTPKIIETKEAIQIVSKCIEKSQINGADIKKFGEELGRSLALNFHKYASGKLKNQQKDISMEYFVSLISTATTAWSACILESKAICHHRKSLPDYRNFLEEEYMPNIIEALVTGRNIAIDEKKRKQREGDTGEDDDVPGCILIPEKLPEDFIQWGRKHK